tara:strand:+ start:248 stop:547 length:300 start_codon:yes stop_codon:yes gene_type:complete
MDETQLEDVKNKFMNDFKTGNSIVDKYINEMGKIDIALAADIACEECQFNQFQLFHYLKKIPEISSPSGRPVIIPIQAFSCMNCGHVNKDFTTQSRGEE